MSPTSSRPLRLFAALLLAAALLTGCSSREGAPSQDAGPQQPGDAAGGDAGGGDSGPDNRLCEPGTSRCRDLATRLVCADDGADEVAEPCEGDLRCDEATGSCREGICTPGSFQACTDEGLQRYCNPSGTAVVEAPCPGGAPCEGGRCQAPECEVGAIRCLDDKSLQICNEAGAYVPGERCPLGTECFNGSCEPLCELNKKVSSYIGCEYWSVDLDNFEEALSQPHAIVVTNVNPELTAEVTLELGYSGQYLEVGHDGAPFELRIPPGQARVYLVPSRYNHSGTRIYRDKAIRVLSNIPVVAHQFNPLNNSDLVYSNDGTVLLPTNVAGREYYGMSWPYRGYGTNIFGFLTIVNSSGLPNQITITPRAEVAAGQGIAPIMAGEARTFMLGPGESLNLATRGTEYEQATIDGCLKESQGPPQKLTPCPDLTGTHVQATQPVTVFGGHQCANVVQGVDRCDHIESILLPTSSWGKDYVGTKFKPRASGTLPEPDVWRVIAQEDNTKILTEPPLEGVHNLTLKAGEWRQFEVQDHFRLGASKPVMVTQYMVGSNWLGIPRICNKGIDANNPTGIGDPAMAVGVPTDQVRTDYIVLTPKDYEEDYLNVVRKPGAIILLDGQPIADDAFRPVGARGVWQVAALRVPDGFHRLTSDVPFGVTSYGYDCHVSYAFPGGMNVERIIDN